MKKNILIIWGVSGAGKTALVNILTTYHFGQIKTTTTRPKRTPNENDYHFVSKSQFKKLNTFAETNFAGNYYGTDLNQVKQQLEWTPNLVTILTWSGVVNYIKEFKNTNVNVIPILLNCPIYEAVYRLNTRSDKHITKSIIRSRIKSFKQQFNNAIKSSYTSYVVNNRPDLSKQQNLIHEIKQLRNILN